MKQRKTKKKEAPSSKRASSSRAEKQPQQSSEFFLNSWGSRLPGEQQRRLCELEWELTALRAKTEELQETIMRLQQSRDHYQGLFEAAPVGYLVLDATGFIHEWNHRALSLFRLRPEVNLQGPFVRFLRGTDIQIFLNHIRRCCLCGETAADKVSLRTGDSERIPVELISIPQRLGSGRRILGCRTAIIDNTGRKAAEEALSKTQQDYLALVDAIEGIVWEADSQTLEMTFLSRSTEAILGYSPKFWYEPGFWNGRMHVNDRERVANLKLKAVAERKPLVVEYRMVRGDRSVIWMHDSMSVREKQGKLKLCGVAVDITARKRAEEELQRAQERLEIRVGERTMELRETISELEALSYSLSHDMRAPLRAMQGYSQLLLARLGTQLDPVGQDYLRRIMSSAERLDLLIKDVLQFAKVTRVPVELKEINLEKLVADVLQNYPDFQSPNAAIEIERPLLLVRAHEAFLTQCVFNLLSNAVKFVRPGQTPKVRMWTRAVHGKVELWVEDNGIGIHPEDQKRIFGIFQRLHPNQQFEGTGIGLAIVRKAIERMGGAIGLESAVGQGTKFWLQLQSSGT